MGKERKVYRVLVGKPGGKRHSEDWEVDRMGSEWFLARLAAGWGCRVDLTG
jgi:hypothetical protein